VASTGTKNRDYSDVLYVEELIGPNTVNTVPPATLDAFRDHGKLPIASRKMSKMPPARTSWQVRHLADAITAELVVAASNCSPMPPTTVWRGAAGNVAGRRDRCQKFSFSAGSARPAKSTEE
jgi:transaldolase/glucose-6-phosphate isomerase